MEDRDEELYERYCTGELTGADLSDIYRARSIVAMAEEFSKHLLQVCAKIGVKAGAFEINSQKQEVEDGKVGKGGVRESDRKAVR
jgi:hypothetical protein